ncbi:MAG: hypothetical protein LBV27_08790 [Oscillospiraceae bacterium]|jgi:hypothetical protein|nr:hypothetical protein [Oscillospiraceae bacterium]
MQDVFIEYMVKKQNPPALILLRIGIVLAAVFLFFVFFIIATILGPFSFIAVLAAFASIYGAYMLITSMNIEFEYSLTNGELDIDKIIAQRKRKRLISIKCKEVEDFGKYNAAEHEGKAYQTKLFACANPNNEDLWYFTLHHKEKGLMLIVFNASERMLNGIKPFLPRPVMHKAFRIGS